MTMDSTPAAIAAGLSEAQRRYLLGEMRPIGNPACYILCGEDATKRATTPTRVVLTRGKIIEPGRFGPTMLTELGIQVRALLQDRDDGE